MAIMIALLGLFGWVTLQEIRQTAQQLEALEERLAREEFSGAVQDTLSRVRTIASRLADWDEVHQQLENPTYYVYWHQHRLLKPGNLPDFIMEAGVYDREGRPLAQLPNDPLPARLPFAPDPRVRRKGDLLLLELSHPVTKGKDPPRGYLVLQADLMAALRKNSLFSHLDFGAIDPGKVPETPLSPAALPSRLDLTPLESPARRQFMKTIEQAMLRLGFIVIVVSLAMLVLFSLLVRRPLVRLSEFVTRLKKGEHTGDELSDSQLIRELEEIRLSLRDYHFQLETARLDLDAQNRKLWELAHKDSLTGTWNRRAFEHDWQSLRELLDGRRMCIAFVLFDCDHFKAINDSYGHQTGDEVIHIIADSIQQELRRGDRLYRLGGDEFATLLLDCDTECANKLAVRCLNNLRQQDFSRLGIHEPVQLSIGIAVYDAQQIPDLTELKHRADMAMYHAKRPGAHHICFFDPERDSDAGMLYSSQAIHAVQQAVRHGEGIRMHYQPICRLENDQPEYVEALARLQADDGLITPAQFLPIVEAHRLEEEFDKAVLQALMQDCRQGVMPEKLGLSLNLSASGLLSKEVMELLAQLAATTGDRLLILEITESALITRLQDATRQLSMAQEMGYSVALDDFGSGYSSLRYLASMPVQIVKFDLTMVRYILEGSRERSMIEGIVQMIAKAGYHTVAEGIEDEKALAIIRRAGFTYGQGYHFGRPSRPVS